MAKLAFSKLGIKTDTSVSKIFVNEQEVEVKNYLPLDKKMELLSNVISAVWGEDDKYINRGKLECFFALEVMYAYTNLTFTDKMKEDPTKLYDMIFSSGLYHKVCALIQEELNFLYTCLFNTLDSMVQYQRSALGIMETIGTNYQDVEFNAEKVRDDLADPGNMAFLKDVLTKLG